MSLFPLFSCFNSNSPVMIKRTNFYSKNRITHFEFATMDSVIEFLYPKFILFVMGFWSSLSTYFLHLLHYFTRLTCNSGSSKRVSYDLKVELRETMEEKQGFLAEQQGFFEEKIDFFEFLNEENDEKEDENEAYESSFTFKFPTFEEFSKNQKDFSVESSSVHGKIFSEYVDSQEVSSEDSELYTNLNDGFESNEFKFLDFRKGSVHVFDDDQSKDDFEDQEYVVKLESLNGKKIVEMEEKEEIHIINEEKLQKVNVESIYSSANEKKISEVNEKEEVGTFNEHNFQSVHDENVYSSTDSNMDSTDSNNLNSPMSNLQPEDGFLSDGDFELEFDEKEENWMKSDFLSGNDFVAKSRNVSEPDETNENEIGNEKNSSNDTSNKLESLWEHQELIEQLKMEMKKVKAIGLPTIFEESESPAMMMEELKPWKIEEAGGKMGEVHKFYKSYRERMRKFDIFSYQKMYTIGFLQLKDPILSSSSSSSLVPEFTMLLTQSFSTNKGKKYQDDPTMKFVKELQSDLEVVYVGQMCMSWEILHWQYEKALDIWESDPRGVRRFNEIAGEFQQFQVLMQRFIEDEPFQDPRIQNYVKSRCVFRNLLQVPVIRADDQMKNKKARSEVVYDITSDVLVEILEESIRIFWRFVRADKYKRQTPIEFQKPEDFQLFMDLQKDLHKKERKLKEQLRSGNCILKKLSSCREDDETDDQVLYFFCQLDMKLVSRVLQMTRITTDQLIWCHNKLSKVSVVNRKIHVEPSFLLFPC